MEIVAQILAAIAWPLVVLVIALMLRRPLLDLLPRVRQVEAKGIKLILERLEEEGQPLPFGARKELSGLTSHDIWALESFAQGQMPLIPDLKPGQRVAARALVEAGLVSIRGEGPSRRLEVTELGKKILAAAESLL
jgi:hypothetical protein